MTVLGEVFRAVLFRSLAASVAVLAVLPVRLALRRVPKAFSCALWGIVLLRLLCPVSVQSPVSLFSLIGTPAVQQSVRIQAQSGPVEEFAAAATPAPEAAAPETAFPAGQRVPQESPARSDGGLALVWDRLLPLLWLIGLAAMLCAGALRTGRLRRAMVGASPVKKGVYVADHIGTAFVLGLFRPKIYLPSGLDAQGRELLLAHEHRHIRRGDPVFKFLSYLALCLHWFNPLIWLACAQMEQDMELACDEAVTRDFDGRMRACYAEYLLKFTAGQGFFTGAPLAFGEGSVKMRIKNVLKNRRCAKWALGVAAAVLLALAVVLLTDPAEPASGTMGPGEVRTFSAFFYDPATPPVVQATPRKGNLQYGVASAADSTEYLLDLGGANPFAGIPEGEYVPFVRNLSDSAAPGGTLTVTVPQDDSLPFGAYFTCAQQVFSRTQSALQPGVFLSERREVFFWHADAQGSGGWMSCGTLASCSLDAAQLAAMCDGGVWQSGDAASFRQGVETVWRAEREGTMLLILCGRDGQTYLATGTAGSDGQIYTLCALERGEMPAAAPVSEPFFVYGQVYRPSRAVWENAGADTRKGAPTCLYCFTPEGVRVTDTADSSWSSGMSPAGGQWRFADFPDEFWDACFSPDSPPEGFSVAELRRDHAFLASMDVGMDRLIRVDDTLYLLLRDGVNRNFAGLYELEPVSPAPEQP